MRTTRKFDYSDLDLDFIAHPTTGDIVKKTGEDAVKRSIRNLVLTNFYDRKFRPDIGSNTHRLLFELINPMTAGFIKDAIVNVIENYEPRAILDPIEGVVVVVDEDNNGYIATIRYTVANSGRPVAFDLFLERLR